jgi:homoserine O-acetyltransferase/O-succinyltransferase
MSELSPLSWQIGLRSLVLAEQLPLQSVDHLPRPVAAFHTFGQLNQRRDNVIWVCHALTGHSDVANWWRGLFGPGRFLDPTRHFIVCANVLGGCYGSSGPTSINPATAIKWAEHFPAISIADIVNHQRLLADALDLRGIECVIGGSMGGFQALQWAIKDARVRSLVSIASSDRQPPHAIALSAIQDALVRLDLERKGNGVLAEKSSASGLSLARQIAHLSYRHPQELDSRFSNNRHSSGEFEVLRYLQHQGEKLVARFDPISYLRLNQALSEFSVSAADLANIRVPTLVVSLDGDQLYPAAEQARLTKHIAVAEHTVVASECGHDGFLNHADRIDPHLRVWHRRQFQSAQKYRA